jgi:Rrf2 family protein
MLLSKPVSYALRALTCLAHHRGKGVLLSSRIAAEQSIPGPFLVKILGALTTAGIVSSIRGPGGGFKLAKETEKISLYDVHTVFEGVALAEECLIGLGKCGEIPNCPVHQHWKEPKQVVNEFLKSTTIADLLNGEGKAKRPAKR